MSNHEHSRALSRPTRSPHAVGVLGEGAAASSATDCLAIFPSCVPSRFVMANECLRWRAVLGAAAQRQQRAFARALRHRWDKAAAKAAAEKAAAAKAAADKAAADKAKAAAEELRRRATALGLLQVLTTANIADDATLKKSIAFCDEQGVTSVSDLVEYNLVDDFVRHLGLKNVPGKKLLSMLQTPKATAAKATAAKAAAESVAQQARIADVADEPLELMGPITGVMKCVRLSLMDAAAASGVEDIDAHAFMASEAGAQLAAADPHGLDADEAGGLWLYTAQSEFYPTLNQLLRNRDRSALIPFFPYLQLMLTARSKLPKYTGSVWRGVKGIDLRAKYPTDKEVWWWAFSSTTKQLKTLTTFLGTSGVRTVFMIEIFQGVDLQRYSAFQGKNSEVEVLLYPGTKLKVVGSMEMGGGLFQVHLREVPLAFAVFK